MTIYEDYREKKNHGREGFPFDIYSCVIPDELPEVLPHWHDEVELIYIRHGKGNISVDGESRDLTGPALAIVFPGQLHSIRRISDERMEYRNIIFHPNLLYSKNGGVTEWEYLRPMFEGRFCVPSFLDTASENLGGLTELLEVCGDRVDHEDAGYPLLVKSQLFLLCYRLLREYPEKVRERAGKNSRNRIKPVLTYLMQNYAEDITVADAAKVAGFSKAHFMRFFHEVTGESFVNYLRSYRLARAAERIRTTDESILQIAEGCGFRNLSYFIRNFKVSYGLTPLQYRREKK